MSAATNQPYSVQRLRGGFALVRWEPDENGKIIRRRRTLTATDRPGAEAEARKIWSAGDGGEWTVARIMNTYLATISHKASHGRRQDAWKAMRSFWGKTDPALIDDAMARSYRASRRVSDATARYELLQLSTALGWAVKEGHIERRPAIWLPQKPERKEEKHLTRAQFDRFLSAVKAPHMRLYVLLGLYTMARPGAILGLTWSRIDFMRRRIDFREPGRERTAKRRGVKPIGDALMPALQEFYAARTSPYVIEWGGDQVKCVKKAFQAASKRSGVHATPYTLRHTGAVWAAEAGISMPELAQMMDHDDDRTTQASYARFSPDYLARVVEAISGKGVAA
jgi:integrase